MVIHGVKPCKTYTTGWCETVCFSTSVPCSGVTLWKNMVSCIAALLVRLPLIQNQAQSGTLTYQQAGVIPHQLNYHSG